MQSFMAGSRLGYGLLAKLANGQRANLDLSKRGADLSRGPLASSKLPAAAWSNTWPAPAATLDLDFANNRGFVRGSGQGGAMDAVTFTRASSGNWVDNTGVLRTGAGTFTGTANALGVNLISNPQNFDNASWTKTNTTVLANQIFAPDNTITAYSFFHTSTSSSYLGTANFVFSNSVNYAVSVYLKYVNNQWVRIDAGQFAVWFDIQNGVVGGNNATIGTLVSSSITDVGGGWYRCAYVVTKQFDNNPVAFVNVTANNSNTRVASTLTYIWGAQLEVGSSATIYYPTNINAPRFDWASTATNASQVNLFTYTEQFDNAEWQKANTTVTANQTTAPDGNSTADLLAETTASASHALTSTTTFSFVAGTSYTTSIYVKKGSGATAPDIVQLSLPGAAFGTSQYANFNISTGTVTASSGGTANIQNIGSGWYRISWVASATSTTTSASSVLILVNNNSTATRAPVYAGATTANVFVWGAQFEQNSSATAYQAISQPTTNTPLVANSTCNGLLIEESRTNRILWCRDGLNGGTAVGTNLLTYSEQFQQSGSWSLIGLLAFGSGSTADATTAPNGTVTADLITEDTGSVGHGVQQLNAAIASTYTYSVYAKAASGTRYVQLRPYVSANNWGSVVFDLATATVTQSSKGSGANVAVPTGTITSVGSGWYRCSIVFTNAAVLNNVAVLMCASGTPTLNTSFGYDPYTGNGTSGIYIWGAQLTPSNVLTDYQVTAASAVTNVWSKSNVTVAKTATGIDGVANAATTITASANNAVLIQPISLASGSRTGSVYLKRITGTGNVQVTLDGSTWSTVDLSNGLWNRIVLSGTVTNPCVGVLLATNGDAVAMDYAQVEDGAFVTSPILTTTATATRAIDSATIQVNTFNNMLIRQNFCYYYEGDTAGNSSNVTNFMAVTNSALNTTSVYSQISGTQIRTAGATVVFSPVPTNGTTFKFASLVSLGYPISGSYNNGTLLQSSTNAAFDGSVFISTSNYSVLFIGGNVGAAANGRVKRFIGYPQRINIDSLNDLVRGTN